MIYVISKKKANLFPDMQEASLLDLKKWLRGKSILAIDSETRSNDFTDIFATEIIMFQIGDKYDQWIIDTRDIGLSQIKTILEDSITLKIGHNIKYDYKVLRNCCKITLENVWDTLVVEQLLDNGNSRQKGYYTLQSTHLRHCGTDPYGDQLSLFDPFIPKSKRNEISKKEEEPFTTAEIFYGATDIVTAFKVYEKQLELVKENEQVELMNLENEFVLVLGDCELNGIPINQQKWCDLAVWSSNKADEELANLRTLYPEITNWNSSVQVKKLFKSIGIPISKNVKGETKDTVASTAIIRYKDQFDIITPYLRYKGFAKLSSTYGVKFLQHVSPYTGRIHSSFVQNVNTGRTASSAPNLQNIKAAKPDFPEGVWWREAFECYKGNVFIISDYSSQELNIAADKSQDETMLNALRNGEDLHRLAASGLYNKPINEITPEERKNGKIVNFSIIYGAGEDKIAEFFNCSKSKAKQLLQGYFQKFPKLKPLQDASFNRTVKNGYITIDELNRRCYVPEYEEYQWLSKNVLTDSSPEFKKRLKALTGKIFRDSSNYIIQGQAADMSKYAGILLRREAKKTDKFKIILLVHDEWLLECSSDDAEEVTTILQNCMGIAADRFCASVQIKCEAHVSINWSK